MYRFDMLNRRKQIDTLKIFNDNVSEVLPDSEYRVDFTSGQNNFSLFVTLTPEFPLQHPILRITPSIQHMWVNPAGDEIISAPGLLNFTIHSDLGRVVQAVIRELQLRPPYIIGHQNEMPSYSYNRPSTSSAIPYAHMNQNVYNTSRPSTASPSFQSVNQIAYTRPSTTSPSFQQIAYTRPSTTSPSFQQISYTRPSTTSSPSYQQIAYTRPSTSSPSFQPVNNQATNTLIPDLSSLSIAELEQLNENDKYLDAYVYSLSHMEPLDNTLDSLISTNEILAGENLEKEEKLKELTEITQEKVKELTRLQELHDSNSQLYDRLIQPYAPHSIRDCLKVVAENKDDESEKIAEDFLSKQIDLDNFLLNFLEKRTISHRLRVKEERLSFQLDALHKAGF